MRTNTRGRGCKIIPAALDYASEREMKYGGRRFILPSFVRSPTKFARFFASRNFWHSFQQSEVAAQVAIHSANTQLKNTCMNNVQKEKVISGQITTCK